MNKYQICTHCRFTNLVFGVYTAGTMEGESDNLIYCGNCGFQFQAQLNDEVPLVKPSNESLIRSVYDYAYGNNSV